MADNLVPRILAWLSRPLRRAVQSEAERALREANERFELVMAGADAAVWDWDVVGNTIAHSSRWKAMRGFARVERCLGIVRLSHLTQKAPAALSGGQKPRLALASVLALQPRILVLDEPTSDLDPAGRRELMDAIRALRPPGDLTLLMIDPETDEMGWACRPVDRPGRRPDRP